MRCGGDDGDMVAAEAAEDLVDHNGFLRMNTLAERVKPFLRAISNATWCGMVVDCRKPRMITGGGGIGQDSARDMVNRLWVHISGAGGMWLGEDFYCLERCCELQGVARLHGRDWYYEGGLQLLAAQKGSGSFRSGHASTLQLDSTCFAILFLAKASTPAPLTGR